jgi:hypothetical protein
LGCGIGGLKGSFSNGSIQIGGIVARTSQEGFRFPTRPTGWKPGRYQNRLCALRRDIGFPQLRQPTSKRLFEIVHIIFGMSRENGFQAEIRRSKNLSPFLTAKRVQYALDPLRDLTCRYSTPASFHLERDVMPPMRLRVVDLQSDFLDYAKENATLWPSGVLPAFWRSVLAG